MHESGGPNRWKGLSLGLVGGAAGTLAMGGYWRIAQAVLGSDPRAATRGDGPHALADISLVGAHHTEEESSTAAMGRIAYTRLAGKPPESPETASTLSYVVHYGYGIAQGGLFGALGSGRMDRIVAEGAAYGTGLWLFGDELGISLLGLADGPGRYPLSQHLARWGAHIAYGVALSATTTVLRRIV